MTSRSTRSRHREKAGLIVLGDIVLPEIPLVDVLVRTRRLDPNMADDRTAITAAAQQLLIDMSVADVDLTPRWSILPKRKN